MGGSKKKNSRRKNNFAKRIQNGVGQMFFQRLSRELLSRHTYKRYSPFRWIVNLQNARGGGLSAGVESIEGGGHVTLGGKRINNKKGIQRIFGSAGMRTAQVVTCSG